MRSILQQQWHPLLFWRRLLIALGAWLAHLALTIFSLYAGISCGDKSGCPRFFGQGLVEAVAAFPSGYVSVGVEYSWPGSRAFKASFFGSTPLTFSYSYIHGNLASSTSRPSKRTRETGLANLTITTSVLRIHASRGSQILFVGSGKLYGGAGPVYGGPKATVNPKGLSVAFASGILGKTINRRLCAFPGFSNWHTTQ